MLVTMLLSTIIIHNVYVQLIHLYVYNTFCDNLDIFSVQGPILTGYFFDFMSGR